MITSLLAMSLLSTPGVEGTPQPQAEVVFCHFALPEAVKHQNVSFQIVYSFTVSSDGHPTNIAAISDSYVGQEAVEACISKWDLSAFPEGRVFHYSSYWEHGVGWVSMTLTGLGLRIRIKQFGDPSPYSATP